MVLNLAGSIGVTLILNTAKFLTDLNTTFSRMDKLYLKTKEVTSEFARSNAILDTFTSTIKYATVGLTAMFTSALAFSPQFRTFLARLVVPFRDLGNYLTSELSPSFDKIVNLVSVFVDKIKKFNEEFQITDKINAFVGKTIDFIINFKIEQLPQLLDDILNNKYAQGLVVMISLGFTYSLYSFAAGGAGIIGLVAGALGLGAVSAASLYLVGATIMGLTLLIGLEFFTKKPILSGLGETLGEPFDKISQNAIPDIAIEKLKGLDEYINNIGTKIGKNYFGLNDSFNIGKKETEIKEIYNTQKPQAIIGKDYFDLEDYFGIENNSIKNNVYNTYNTNTTSNTKQIENTPNISYKQQPVELNVRINNTTQSKTEYDSYSKVLTITT